MQIFSKMIVASSVFLFASLQTQLLEVFLKRSRRLCISSSKSSSKKNRVLRSLPTSYLLQQATNEGNYLQVLKVGMAYSKRYEVGRLRTASQEKRFLLRDSKVGVLNWSVEVFYSSVGVGEPKIWGLELVCWGLLLVHWGSRIQIWGLELVC